MNKTEEQIQKPIINISVSIVIGLVGVYIRFASFPHASSNS